MFTCYCCGQPKDASDASDEHIIPSCIGGNRNATLTHDVCGGCNQFAGNEIDRPFGRDAMIQAMRVVVGVNHKGKRPIAFRGELQWKRPERVRIYQVERAARVALFDCADGSRALAVLAPPDPSAQMETIVRVLDTRFEGIRVLNGQHPLTRYDHELLHAFTSLDGSERVRCSIDLNTWHRAIVKIALGLASQTFGADFVTSSAAAVLRAYLWEPDAGDAMRWDYAVAGGRWSLIRW